MHDVLRPNPEIKLGHSRSLSQAQALVRAVRGQELLQTYWISLQFDWFFSPQRSQRFADERRGIKKEELWLQRHLEEVSPQASSKELSDMIDRQGQNFSLQQDTNVALLAHPDSCVRRDARKLLVGFEGETAEAMLVAASEEADLINNLLPPEHNIRTTDYVWPTPEDRDANEQRVTKPEFMEKLKRANHLLLMHDGYRHLLTRIIGGELEKAMLTPSYTLQNILDEIEMITEAKLATLGMNLEDYFSAYEALKNGDTQTLVAIAKKSREIIDLIHATWNFASTKEKHKDPQTGRYTSERSKLHKQIRDDALDGMQSKERPVMGIFGAPMGGGKSRMVKKVMNERHGIKKFVELDPDKIRTKLMPNFVHGNEMHRLMTQEEAFDISDLIMEEAFRRNYDVAIEGTFRNVDWIQNYILKHPQYQVEVAFMHQKEIATAFRNTVALRTRGVALDEFLSSLIGYINFYTLANTLGVDRSTIFTRATGFSNLEKIFDQIGLIFNADYDELEKLRNQVLPLLQAHYQLQKE